MLCSHRVQHRVCPLHSSQSSRLIVTNFPLLLPAALLVPCSHYDSLRKLLGSQQLPCMTEVFGAMVAPCDESCILLSCRHACSCLWLLRMLLSIEVARMSLLQRRCCYITGGGAVVSLKWRLRLLPPVSAAFLSPGHRAGFHERGQTELLRAQLLGMHAAHARSRAAVEALRVLLLLPFLRSGQMGAVARRLVTWPALIVAANHSSCFE